MAQNIHFIDINDATMCDLAMAMQQQGHIISCSAETISATIHTKLSKAGLLPLALGWFPEKLTRNLRQVILSRTVSQENPEYQIALALGLPVMAYPDYIYAQAVDKQRIVFTGGLENNYIFAILTHILHYWHRQFDYVWQKPISGWQRNLQLTDAPIILLQADALPISALNHQPQFLAYQHNILVISGLGEEFAATYATVDEYLQTLALLADATPKGGILIYNQTVPLLNKIAEKKREDIKTLAYQTPQYYTQNQQTYLHTAYGNIPVAYEEEQVFQAIAAARILAANLGIDEKHFYEAIPSLMLN